MNIRRGIEQPKNLIDLTSIEEVQEIEETKSGLSIGSGVTLNRVRDSAVVKKLYPAVADAAKAIAGPTHQQYGTVGGNICLDTRCLFTIKVNGGVKVTTIALRNVAKYAM